MKWKVQPAPTGQYRSFQRRGWPHAKYPNGRIAASIGCEDDYCPSDVRKGQHTPLTLYVADYSVTPFKWRKAKGEFKTLTEAKKALDRVLAQHPEIAPKDAA